MLSSFGTATGSRTPHLVRSLQTAPMVEAESQARTSQILSADQLIELQSKRSRVIKRSGDIIFSLAVLGLGSPIFLALAVLVKLTSRGPVFYVQQRVGRDYRSFGCIKFRTMRRDADRILSRILLESPDLQELFEQSSQRFPTCRSHHSAPSQPPYSSRTKPRTTPDFSSGTPPTHLQGMNLPKNTRRPDRALKLSSLDLQS